MFPLLAATRLNVNHAFDKFEYTRAREHHTKVSSSTASPARRSPQAQDSQRSMLQVFVLDLDLLDYLSDALSVIGATDLPHIDILRTQCQKPGIIYDRVKQIIDKLYTLSTVEFSATIELMLTKIDDHFDNRQATISNFNRCLDSQAEGISKTTSINISKLLLVYSSDLTQINNYLRVKKLQPISFKRMFSEADNLAPYIISSAIVTSCELLHQRYKYHMGKSGGEALMSAADFQFYPHPFVPGDSDRNIIRNSGILPGTEPESGLISSVLLSKISERMKIQPENIAASSSGNVAADEELALDIESHTVEVQTDEYQDQIVELKKKVQELTTENTRLIEKANTLTAHYSERETNESERISSALTAANAEIELLKKQLADIYAQNGNKDAEIEKLSLDMQLVEGNAQRLRQNLEEMTKRLEEATVELDSLRENSTTTCTLLAEERTTCTKQQGIISRMTTQIQTLLSTVFPVATDKVDTATADELGDTGGLELSSDGQPESIETQLDSLVRVTAEYHALKSHANAIEMVCEEQRKKLQTELEKKEAMVSEMIETDNELFLRDYEPREEVTSKLDLLSEIITAKDAEIDMLKKSIEDYHGQLTTLDETSNAKVYLKEVKALRNQLENYYEDTLTSAKTSMLSSVTEYTSHKSEEIAKLNESLSLKTQMLEAAKAKLKENEAELASLQTAVTDLQRELAQRDELIRELLLKVDDAADAKQITALNTEISSRDAIIAEMARMQNMPPVWAHTDTITLKNDVESLLQYITRCTGDLWLQARPNVISTVTTILDTISAFHDRLSLMYVTSTLVSESHGPDSSSVASSMNESAGVVRFQLATSTRMSNTAIHMTNPSTAISSLASTAKSFDDYVEISDDSVPQPQVLSSLIANGIH